MRPRIALMAVLAVLAALALVGGACTGSHDSGAVEVRSGDCVTCHLDDSPHTDGRRSCGDCHLDTAWLPALDGAHPEDRFPIASGPHGRFTCFECHVADSPLPSTGGMNTSCVGCHTGAHNRTKMDNKHAGQQDYAWDDANPRFCLRCHPRGRKQ